MKVINISGEPREYKEGAFIYEFPFPSKIPTIVPDILGKKLIETKQFKQIHDEHIKEHVETETGGK